MFVILALFLVAILIVVVPAIAASVARNVATNVDRRASSGSIDQSLVEARLGRIEEAIDAMAVQIERLSEHQRSLLGPDSGASRDEEASRLRTEN